MADYIYLMQNRLSPPQWRALEAVREAARAQGMPVFLVGGAVRDLTSYTPVRDLDFAVQGDARALVAELEGKGGQVAGGNEALPAVYLTFPSGVRVEIAPTVSVSYPKPGQPEVRPAAILDDLRRRDFTANAMAVSLNDGSYGLLLDPLNGTADLENRELRLTSPYAFIEQPALLLRAARLGERLGWSMEERTQGRYETSKEAGHIGVLPAADRDYELEEIFHEDDPVAILEYMAEEGWLEGLFPGLRGADADRSGLDEVRELTGRLEAQGLHPDPSGVNFPLVTAKMNEANRATLKARFPRQGFVRGIESLDARSKELGAQLTSKTAAAPSDAWRLLMGTDAEVVLALGYNSRSAAVQNKLKAFFNDWPPMRQKIPYALMQEARITPDLPGYDKLLDDLFFALIDGKLETPEAIRAFLEPYSPPAPAQVQVRRRPAKATRSRAVKKAGKSQVVKDGATAGAARPGEAVEEESAKAKAAPGQKRVADVAADKPDAMTTAPANRGPAPKAVKPKVAASEAVPAQAAESHPAKSQPAKASVNVAAVKTAVGKKTAAPAGVPTPAKPKPLPHKAAPEKGPAKKSAPVKAAVKKVATKQVVKPAAQKAVPAKKAAATKAVPPKKPAGKVMAKPLAKKAPAKAAKKAASKTKARR